MRDVPLAMAAKLRGAANSYAASFDEARMDDIARASGVPRATLYYYFAGKEDVLAFLLKSMIDEMRASVAAAADSAADTRERLLAVVRAQLDVLSASPATSQLLLANLGRAGKLPDIAAGIQDGFHLPVQRILEEGLQRGEITEVDAGVVTTALFGAVTIVGLRDIAVEGAIDTDKVVGSLFPLFWAGLARPKRKPTKR